MKKLLILIISVFTLLISCSKPVQNDEHIKKAHSFYLNGDFTKAENEARISLKINPDLKEANILLARIYFRNGMDAEFQKIIKGLIKKNQFDIDALRLNALYLIKQKKYKDARENLNQILAISEDDISSLYLLGSLNQIDGNINEAVKYYTIAMKSYVHLKKIHDSLVGIYTKLELKERAADNKKISEAISNFEESFK
jgi:tetratricopeptide (TPR) repeat protein